MTTRHPSFLVLDRYRLGEVPSDDVQRHIESCPDCQEYIGRIRRSLPIPDWAREVMGSQPRRRLSFAWVGGVTAVLVLVGIGFILLPTHQTNEAPRNTQSAPGFTTVRGSASVGLYIKRGQKVFLWDGERPVHPGDRLRLKVVGGEYSHISVFLVASGGADEHLERLYSGRLDETDEGLLPRAWRVDAAPNDEVLVIALGEGPLTESDIESTSSQDVTTDALWVRRLRIPKETSQGNGE